MGISKEQAAALKGNVSRSKHRADIFHGALYVSLPINPMSAPRQTRRDAWSPSEAVKRYRAWKDDFVSLCAQAGWSLGDVLEVKFSIPMPPSWSGAKKLKMNGTPHQQKPDIDNMCKAVMDAFRKDDSNVHTIIASKVWANDGSITLKK